MSTTLGMCVYNELTICCSFGRKEATASQLQKPQESAESSGITPPSTALVMSSAPSGSSPSAESISPGRPFSLGPLRREHTAISPPLGRRPEGRTEHDPRSRHL